MAAFCTQCGSEVPAEAKFCPECGQAGERLKPGAAVVPGRPDLGPQQRPGWQRGCLIAVIIVGALIGLGAIAALLGGGDDEPSNPAATQVADAPAGDRLYPDRVDAQPEDQEKKVGDGAEIKGVRATVRSAGFQQSVDEFQDAGYIVADIALQNTSGETRPYSEFDWKVQTPDGRVDDIDFVVIDGDLSSGDLVAGGTTSGKIAFEVGGTKGTYYLIWKPDSFDAARGIWQVKI